MTVRLQNLACFFSSLCFLIYADWKKQSYVPVVTAKGHSLHCSFSCHDGLFPLTTSQNKPSFILPLGRYTVTVVRKETTQSVNIRLAHIISADLSPCHLPSTLVQVLYAGSYSKEYNIKYNIVPS